MREREVGRYRSLLADEEVDSVLGLKRFNVAKVIAVAAVAAAALVVVSVSFVMLKKWPRSHLDVTHAKGEKD